MGNSVDFVGAVADGLLRREVQSVAQQTDGQLLTQIVGGFAARGQQFPRVGAELAFAGIAQDQYPCCLRHNPSGDRLSAFTSQQSA